MHQRRNRLFVLATSLLAAGLMTPQTGFALGDSAAADDAATQPTGESKIDVANLDARIDRSVNRAIDFLKNRGQAENGAFSPQTGTAVTSLVISGILEHRPAAVNDPAVKKAIAHVLKNVQPDGGIYSNGSKYRNYETSVGISALVRANRDNEYDSQLKRAEAFMRELQWDEGEGIESSDTRYGGAGYGSHSRPDLSNTSFMLDALKDLGNGADDEAIKKALVFVSRTQNLAGHGNDTANADKINDGGFYYTAAGEGETRAGTDDGGGLRSYGSMTYAGLKSMIYAGLSEDDPRVSAAMDFIRKHYSLNQNPGMGAAGLYYYYHTFGKALDAANIEVLVDANGTSHNWRQQLALALLERQNEDGSWFNEESSRWMEGDRQLVTAYALLALKYAKQPSK
ncbi:MAG: prenyltransferase/squalene oxidase repeat-containing protein [Planctomycetota bacterium]